MINNLICIYVIVLGGWVGDNPNISIDVFDMFLPKQKNPKIQNYEIKRNNFGQKPTIQTADPYKRKNQKVKQLFFGNFLQIHFSETSTKN